MNQKLTIAAAFLATFLIGGTTGFLLYAPIKQVVGEPGVEQKENGERSDSSEDGERRERRFQDMVADKLELSDEQKDAFFDVLKEHRDEARQIIREHRHSTYRDLETTEEEYLSRIEEILDEQQMDEWTEFYEEHLKWGRQDDRNGNGHNDKSHRRDSRGGSVFDGLDGYTGYDGHTGGHRDGHSQRGHGDPKGRGGE